jgi:hypothetical protein
MHRLSSSGDDVDDDEDVRTVVVSKVVLVNE